MQGPVKYSRVERQVLLQVLAGKSPKEIAAHMELSTTTINRRLRAMWTRAGLSSRHELILWTLQHPRALNRDSIVESGLHPSGCLCPAPYCVAMLDVSAA